MATDNTEKTNGKAEPVDPVIRTSGAGKAYQSVAQSTAIAIQDATDNLRNINTIATTAMGVAMAQMLENESSMDDMQKVIDYAKNASLEATRHYEQATRNLAAILKDIYAENK